MPSCARAENGGESSFSWLFEVAIVNSYILYRITATRPSSHSQFLRSVVDALATRHMSTRPPRALGRPRKPPRVPNGDPDRYKKQRNHFPAKGTQRVQFAVTHDIGQEKAQPFIAKDVPVILASAQETALRPTIPPSMVTS